MHKGERDHPRSSAAIRAPRSATTFDLACCRTCREWCVAQRVTAWRPRDLLSKAIMPLASGCAE